MVSLTAPAANSSVAGKATVTLSASASDTGGSISKVDFYNGTT
ncbi:Ig-like domain-containing protein [Undibacterium sp. Xuan67W]